MSSKIVDSISSTQNSSAAAAYADAPVIKKNIKKRKKPAKLHAFLMHCLGAINSDAAPLSQKQIKRAISAPVFSFSNFVNP